MKAPNGLDVRIGDLWKILGHQISKKSNLVVFVLVVDFKQETLGAFTVFRLDSNTIGFMGFNGRPEVYELVSRLDDHS